jgi:hypothetical protein
MERNTYYKRNGDIISYTQIAFLQEECAVVIKTGIRGGKQEVERKEFDDVMPAFDFYLELRRKYKEEDRCFPGTAEIKISMDLDKQAKTLTQEKFKELLQTISSNVEDYRFETVNGDSVYIKKTKGSLYSIRFDLVQKEPALQEIISKLLVLTNNADLTVTEGADKVYTQIPAFTGEKDLEVEFWTDNIGFIFFTLSIGEQIFESRFSDVWDPTRDFKAWLEAICVGVEDCSFMIQNEGEDTKFNLHNWGTERALFFMGWSRDEMNIVEYVNKHQFVEALYTGYLAFINPETFTDKKNWDLDLSSKFKSKIIEEYLSETQ